MRLFATFGLILICCHAWAIETDGYLPHENKYAGPTSVEKLLERLKEMIRTGNDTLGLPPLDPFLSDKLDLNIDIKDMIKLDGVLTNVDVRGLSEYNVNSGDFKLSGVRLMVNLTWNNVYAITNYTMNGMLGGEMPIFGTGKINAGIEGFDFFMEISFTTNESNFLKVKSLRTDFALKALAFKATGLLDDEELSDMLSAIISDMTPQLLQEYKSLIQSYLHPAITDLANDFLSDKTIMDIIRMLG